MTTLSSKIIRTIWQNNLSFVATTSSVPLVHVQAGDSEDEELVTVVEKEKFDVEKKAVTVTDRFRTVEKLLMCENLQDFLLQGNDSQSRLLLEIELYLSNLIEIFCKIKSFNDQKWKMFSIKIGPLSHFLEFSQNGLQFSER